MLHEALVQVVLDTASRRVSFKLKLTAVWALPEAELSFDIASSDPDQGWRIL
jgi:hypothetical protein